MVLDYRSSVSFNATIYIVLQLVIFIFLFLLIQKNYKNVTPISHTSDIVNHILKQRVKMKKIVLAAMLTSGLMAADSGLYIGVDAGNTAMDVTVTNGSATSKQTIDGGSQTLKVGYYLDKNSRVAAAYQHINTSGSNSASAYLVGYDYMIGEGDFKPFVGAILGYSKYSQSNLTLNGALYGAQAGLNYAFMENFSVEAGYRYMASSADSQFTASTSKAEVDAIKNWFIGANYKF